MKESISGKHDPVRQVAVVRDCKDLSARLVFVGLQVFPEILRVVAADRANRRIRFDLPGLVAAVAHDHDAVQVVAGGVRGPLEADERGEPVRLVVGLRRLDRDFPGVAIGLGARKRGKRRRESVFRELVDDVGRDGHRCFSAFLDVVVPLLAGRIREIRGIAGEQLREEAHVVGVVGDHDEIERSRELHAHAVRGSDFLAAREPEGVGGSEAGAKGTGVHRGAGMHVGVAEERARRDIAPRMRRIALLRERVRQRFRRRVGFLGRGGCRQHGRDQAQNDRP